jgi:ribosome-associated protein
MANRRASPPLEAEEEPDDVLSRSDLKRANRVLEETLARLGADLSRLNEKKLGLLELPDDLHEALLALKAMESPRARARQLRLVRRALRDADWSGIQKRLLHLLEHGTVPSEAGKRDSEGTLELAWVARLVGEGFAGLDAFLVEFPRADRTHLRQLIRSVERSSGERRLKAERKLCDAVRGFLPRG